MIIIKSSSTCLSNSGVVNFVGAIYSIVDKSNFINSFIKTSCNVPKLNNPQLIKHHIHEYSESVGFMVRRYTMRQIYPDYKKRTPHGPIRNILKRKQINN